MKEEFDELYDIVVQSKDVAKMRVLGKTMKDIMYMLIEQHPKIARQYIDRLHAVKWCNYVSENEADEIVSAMSPTAAWGWRAWTANMDRLGLPMEEEGCYNDYALYTVMSMISSDSGETITKAMRGSGNDAVFSFVHDLAVDKLKDADKRFNVRTYFGL